MSHRLASRRFKYIYDVRLAAGIHRNTQDYAGRRNFEARSMNVRPKCRRHGASTAQSAPPGACRCSKMSLSLLNNLLQQYGPHALPYPEQAKWTVRDHLLELQKVCHMPYVVCLSSCDYQSQHIASRPVRRRSFLRSASARGSSSPGMGGGFDHIQAQLLAHSPSDLLGTQPRT